MLKQTLRIKSWGCGHLVCMITIIIVLLFLYEQKTYAPHMKQQVAVDPHVECRPKCKIPGLGSQDQFREYLKTYEYICKNVTWFGVKAGKKAVCMDPALNMTPGDCHVLSFGINNEWSFDDAFARFGCKVYAFDPTMGKADHQRSLNVRFFNVGIGNINGTRKVGMNRHFKFLEVDRYENILERLNLTHTTIDYIKMDVELSELDFFQDVFRNSPHLLRNIKQIGMELHHGDFGEGLVRKKENDIDQGNEMGPTSTFQLFWQYFHELNCYGIKLIHTSKNARWTETLWARI